MMFTPTNPKSSVPSMKWDYERARTKDSSLIGAGTADMDFPAAKPIRDALSEVARIGYFGYPMLGDSYYEALESWMLRHAGIKVDARKEISHNFGIYPSVWNIFDAICHPGDEVIFSTPVHFCFEFMVRMNDLIPVMNPLRCVNGRYTFDFEQLETLFTKKTKIFWLCNPHNPVGRAWSKEELERVASICLKHNVWILSDDVYCGLLFRGTKYNPIASISPEISQKTITCYSASKSYNMTGIRHSFVYTSNKELLSRYNNSLQRLDLHYGMNVFGIKATEVALRDCDQWLIELMDYIRINFDMFKEALGCELPELTVADSDSTYFAWVDLRSLKITEKDFGPLFEKRAHIVINPGDELGEGGKGFARINLACSHEVCNELIKRFIQVLKERKEEMR
ncbi:MAG: aminotransferase class I/II-fold pyridoxal phosphate-dependent enzyme [Spirochaetales bacterium]|nr:aminotransferase class I/II-fold pyridoxal phosphate-dependent enzyme [Spirochaetales bacterium]